MKPLQASSHREYTKADYIKLVYFIATAFGALYWVIFLVIYPLLNLKGQVLYMTGPYSVVGLALLLVSMDAFRGKHYFLSFNVYFGLIIAGMLS